MIEVQLYKPRLSELLPTFKSAWAIKPFWLRGPKDMALGYPLYKRGRQVVVVVALFAPRLSFDGHTIAIVQHCRLLFWANGYDILIANAA